MRYANEEVPRRGDRIRNSAGGLGTVTAVSRGSARHPEPAGVTVKWDEGIVEIDYSEAAHFALVSRDSETGRTHHGTAGTS